MAGAALPPNNPPPNSQQTIQEAFNALNQKSTEQSQQISELRQQISALGAKSNSSLDPSNSDIEPRSTSKPSRVSFRGKEYEIKIENHGEIKDQLQGYSKKVSTLIGITFQYGIAALLEQNKELSENDIKLKYITIKKKVGDDGKLFITYKDKKNHKKYKVVIDHNLEINADDKKIINEELKEDIVDPYNALKTHEKAIQILEGVSLGSKDKTQKVYTYEMKIPQLTTDTIKYLKNHENRYKDYPRDLKSNSNTKKSDSSQTKNDTNKTKEKKSNLTDPSNKPTKEKGKKEEASTEEVKDPSLSQEEGPPAPNNNSNTPKPSATNSKPPIVEGAPLEITDPFKVSAEEKDLSNIDYKTDNDPTMPVWKKYLLTGGLISGAAKKLLSKDQLPKHHIKRTVNPGDPITKEEVKALYNKIINENSSIKNFNARENVFIKRFLLHCLAYLKYENKPNSIDADTVAHRLNWIRFNYNEDLFTSAEQTQLTTILEYNKAKIYESLKPIIDNLQD